MRAPVKRRGRKRGEFCMGTFGVFHRLTDATRRWKVRVLKGDGLPVIHSNGCRGCQSIGNTIRKRTKRCGVEA